MDPSFFDSSYDRCNDLLLPRIEIPEGFKLNHQSVGNSVSFVVGREFQKLFLCFAFRSAEVLEIGNSYSVVSTNGYSEQHYAGHFILSGVSEHLLLRPVYLGGWNESNPSEQNHVTITVEILALEDSSEEPKITWLGVHVDCICCGSSSVPDDIEHHSLPSDVLPVDTTNGSELGLGQQGLNSFASIEYNNSDVGEHWLLRFLKTPPFSTLCQCFQ